MEIKLPRFVRVKKNDTDKKINGMIFDDNHKPLDLSDAVISFFLKNPVDNSMLVNGGVGALDSTTDFHFFYQFKSGDLSQVGTFLGEFEIRLKDGNKIKAPASRYIRVIVVDELVP